jgi:adenylyltransferase/sulfurtransferase
MMKSISADDFIQLTQKDSFLQVIDVREPYEFALCRTNSPCKNIPMGDIVEKMDQLDQQKALYLICKSGKRANAVANLLDTQYQFSKVFVIEGGIEAYLRIVRPDYEMY